MAHAVIVLLLLGVTPACAASRDLTRATAAKVISSSEEFKKPQIYKLVTGQFFARATMYPKITPGVSPLVSMGLVELKEGQGRHEKGPNMTYTRVSLTEAGERLSRGWKEGPHAEHSLRIIGLDRGKTFEIPLANRELVAITGITSLGEAFGWAVEFTWKWVPTEIGKGMGVTEDVRQGTATLRLYDDGWRLETLSAK